MQKKFRTMRLFLALFFEHDSLIHVQHEIAMLKQKYPRLRFESLERLHLTLWFYGDQVTPELENRILKQLAQLPPIENFYLKLTKPLYLPNSLKPRVFAYEVTSPQLSALLDKIDFMMQQIGLKRERAFLPHITLARIPSNMRPLPDRSELKFSSSDHQLYTLKIKEIALVESILSSEGSSYIKH